MKGPGKGKTNNANGRPKGVPNKTTTEAKELLEQVLYGQIKNIKLALNKIRKNDPAKYLDACSKLFTYVLPKKTDITSDLKRLEPVINVTVDDSKTAEALKKLKDEFSSIN